MSDTFWKPSVEQRRTILLLEALGLIHDLGKLSDMFLRSQEPSSTVQYNHNLLADPRQINCYREFITVLVSGAIKEVQELLKKANEIPCAFGERADLTNILQDVQFADWTGQKYSFAELSPFVAKPGLSKISPLELEKTFGKEMQPGLLIGFIHGVAHIEKEGEPNQYQQPYSALFRATPFGLEERIVAETATAALIALPLLDIEQITSDQRWCWLKKMKTELCRGLADNRRPHNEVSLWDWGYTVATMTKAAAVWIFKNGWPAELNDLPYRTLRINLNKLKRYTYCGTISDALGIRQALDKSFEQVQKLLEETYALANRFYHDETGDYYLFPDLYSDDREMAALRNEIQAQFPSDLRPQVHLGERVTSGELNGRLTSYDPQVVRRLVAGSRTQTLQEPSVRADNNLCLFEDEWSDGRPENAEICMACGVRSLGYPRRGTAPEVEGELAKWATQEKAEQRNICRVCLDRRGRRAQEWATSDLQKTIWTDEVADDNGRLALFIGKLGLERWLDGTMLDTIRVTDKTSKNPSPARLYRIAETARDFWRHVTDKVTSSVVGQRQFRLSIYPAANSLPDLGEYHAYELDVEGLPLSVVWDKPKGRFLTAENLSYFAHCSGINQAGLAGLIQGQTLNVREPSAFQQPSQVLNTVQIERVEQLDGYRPDISLLAEPGVCMILVPAEKALDLARTVKSEYERQMGRVRDRLPLYLGLVFCPRRTPIRAVLEAGRSMLDMAGDELWEPWRLKNKKDLPNPGECELLFENGVTWLVPILAGDCKTPDKWYPRLYCSSRRDDTWQKAHPEDVTKMRVPTQQQPWKIWIRPSRFDFEFLDTTGRRFEICYDKDGRRPRRTRPFYLEDLDRLDALWELMRRMAVSQRHQVIRGIETTREAWYGSNDGNQAQSDVVFRQFVTDTLAGATWRKDQLWTSIPPEWQEKLTTAGASGELADLADLHMEILKEKRR